MFFAQSDRLPCLEKSWTIHLREKQDGVQFCLIYGRRTFLINEIAMENHSKKATKFDNNLFKDMNFVYFIVINALKTCSKCFVYKL